MVNVYSVTIEEANGGGTRHICIITDTIQNALSIGKTKCKWNEEVVDVYTSQTDPVIDFSVIKDGD